MMKQAMTLLLAIPALCLLQGSAEAQALFPPSLSAARRACVPATPALPRYIPGHYEIIRERVRIPGRSFRIYVPGRYESRYRGPFRLPATRYIPARYELHREPDRFEYRDKRVWVPGRYSF